VKEFILPYPVSVNQWTRAFQNRQILTAKARDYRKVGLTIIGEQTPLEGRLELVLELFPIDKRKRDADSPLKACLDLLTHGNVYHDDSQVKRLVVIMNEAGHEMRGLCRVTVTEIAG
jgi:crossover junction endodeoxyribonuclease RusA